VLVCYLCALILLFTLEDSDEGGVVEESLLQGGLLPGLLDLVGGEVVSHVAQEILQVVLVELSGAGVIEHGEGLSDGVLGVSAAELLSEQVQEGGEVELAGGLLQHGVELLIGGHTSEVAVHVLEVSQIDDSITVGVDHGEGLFVLGNLVGLEVP